MKMTLYFSCSSYVILDAIKTDCLSMFITCIVFFLSGVLVEFLLTYKKVKMDQVKEINSLDLDRSDNIKFVSKIKLTLLYTLICFLLYLNMFAMMTYNANIIISVILGNALGYYLFAVSKKTAVRGVNSIGCCHTE